MKKESNPAPPDISCKPLPPPNPPVVWPENDLIKENDTSDYREKSKCRRDATTALEKADSQLGQALVKTCQIKNKSIRILVNSCIREAQFQIDDAISYMDR